MVWHTGRGSGSEGYGNQRNGLSGDTLNQNQGVCIK